MNMKRRLIQYPAVSPAFAIAVRNSYSAATGSTSSASRTKTHSLRKGRFSSAQFFFFGQVPLNSNCTTRAPNSSAMRAEPSALCESTTKISSAHRTEARERGRFPASSLIGTMTDTGTGAVDLPRGEVVRPGSWRKIRISARSRHESQERNCSIVKRNELPSAAESQEGLVEASIKARMRSFFTPYSSARKFRISSTRRIPLMLSRKRV